MYNFGNRVMFSLTLGVSLLQPVAGAEVKLEQSGYIVEAGTTELAVRAVLAEGGQVTRELPIINGVSALLSPGQAALLRAKEDTKVFAEMPLRTQSSASTPLPATTPDIYQRAMIGVNDLAAQGINGTGVTVAVLDSGILQKKTLSYLTEDSNGKNRMVAQYDAINNVLVDATHPCKNYPCVNDDYGHGSHVTGLIASSNTSDPALNGQPQGIAPMAHLISVKAFDANGSATYANVLNGLNWIYTNRNTYGAIRVVNMSFGATPQSFYWNDPIDQAVMKLWQAGIVVVTAAGNFGPAAQTIAVPGNTPYVITVGAMTDNFTPNDPNDDGIASFSSAGPTFEGFVKPDVVAPGGHLAAFMDKDLQSLPAKYPQYGSTDPNLFIMSGTSQAAAVTTGVVALMLQADPSLTPDQVKCRLLITADSAVSSSGYSSYSVYQQGAGRINAYAAVHSNATNCANQGLNIAADIAGTKHYWGPAQHNSSNGDFLVVNSQGIELNNDGYIWAESYKKGLAYSWTNGYMWVNNGYLWNTGFVYTPSTQSNNPLLGGAEAASGYLWNVGYLWNNGYLWNKGYLWNQSAVTPTSAPTAVESWNAQE
jgi:serine protease AprX